MSTVSIGQLDQRLTLESAARVPDGAGGATVTWSTVAEVWAAVRPTGGSETIDSEGLKARITHEVWLRHRDGVHPAMRFQLGTRTLDIRAVLDAVQRRRYLRCLCEERLG
ncbi:MAG: phage head closure protein [Hyphomicrobium sp.]